MDKYATGALSFILGSAVEFAQFTFCDKKVDSFFYNEPFFSPVINILVTGGLSSTITFLQGDCFSHGAIPLISFIVGGNELGIAGLALDIVVNELATIAGGVIDYN